MCYLMDKKWYNYIIFDKIKTYIGSTVDLNRRIRQHNGIIKGGAKYTKGGKWQYYCVIYNIYGHKNNLGHKHLCLSEEYHLKLASYKAKKVLNSYDRRKKAIENYIPKTAEQIKYIIFLSKNYVKYMPKCNSSVFIYIIEDFTMSNIENHIGKFNNFINYNDRYRKHDIDMRFDYTNKEYNADMIGSFCSKIRIYHYETTLQSNINIVKIYDDRFNITEIDDNDECDIYDFYVSNVQYPIINIMFSRYELKKNATIDIEYITR